MSVRRSDALREAPLVLVGLSLLVTACAGGTVEESHGTARAGASGRLTLVGGLWFDGISFEERTMHVEDGIFVEALSAEADSTVDLAGGYVLPPFGDGHTHMLDGGTRLEGFVEQYQSDGIYYVQVLTNGSSGAQEVRDQFNQPGRLDVLYANGGLTSTLGHPFIAYEPRAMGLAWQEVLERRDEVRESRIQERNAYWFLDTPEDLDRQWDDILATRPDLLKIYLLHADDPNHPLDPDAMGLTGLSTKMASAIVSRAHEAGLPVWAHIETVDDFRIGLDIGVDGFAHLPGYQLGVFDAAEDPETMRLPDELVLRAGSAGVGITPTVSLIELYAAEDTARIRRAHDLQRDAIERLRAAGAKILVGTDQYGTTSAKEAWVMARDMMEAIEIVDLWSRETPQAMFPNRRIGRLEVGWEASFIILGGGTRPLTSQTRATCGAG